MLNIIAYNSNTEYKLGTPLSVTILQEVDTPADSVTAVFPFIPTDELLRFEIYNDNKLFFKGNIDEKQVIISPSGKLLKIIGRSLCSLLLDNEAEPFVMINPTDQFVFDKYIRELGFSNFIGNGIAYLGTINVTKGMSVYQVMHSYCQNALSVTPRITETGTVSFLGIDNSQRAIISNNKQGTIKYNTIKENNKYCNLLSEIRVKNSDSGYTASVFDTDTVKKAIICKRYVDATQTLVTPIAITHKMLSNAKAKSYEITIDCIGNHLGLLGSKVTIDDSNIGYIDNLVVTKLHYNYNSNTEITTLTISKE